MTDLYRILDARIPSDPNRLYPAAEVLRMATDAGIAAHVTRRGDIVEQGADARAWLAERRAPLLSLDDCRKANGDSGRCWFSPSAMQFFQSRVSETVYPDFAGFRTLFVSSEIYGESPRVYPVRACSWITGAVVSIEKELSTARAAHACARKAVTR